MVRIEERCFIAWNTILCTEAAVSTEFAGRWESTDIVACKLLERTRILKQYSVSQSLFLLAGLMLGLANKLHTICLLENPKMSVLFHKL